MKKKQKAGREIEKFTDRIMELMPLVISGMMKEERVVLDKVGLGHAHYCILRYLAMRGGCLMGEISAEISLKPSTLTSLVDRLVELGMVRRCVDPGDRRAVRGEVTARGRNVLATMEARVRGILVSQFAKVPVSDLEAHIRVIESAVEDFAGR